MEYNPNQLVQKNWSRYPIPDPNFKVRPTSYLGVVPWEGIDYEISSSLEELRNCTWVQKKENENYIHYKFNVSMNLFQKEVNDCKTQLYQISINKAAHATFSHLTNTGKLVEIVQVTYLPCTDCTEIFGGHSCKTTNNFRLQVQLVLEIQKRSAYYEGFTDRMDIQSSNNSFGFPFHNQTTMMTTSYSDLYGENLVRTRLVLYTACLNIWDDNLNQLDCSRFNHGFGQLDRDYSLFFNLKQCDQLNCLVFSPSNSCNCVDNPPDKLSVDLKLHLYECPNVVIQREIEIRAGIKAYPGITHPNGTFYDPIIPSYSSHQNAILSFELENYIGTMNVAIKTVEICQLIEETRRDCVVNGINCPLGIKKGCNPRQWIEYCLSRDCKSPLGSTYLVIDHYEPYSEHERYFTPFTCKKDLECQVCPWDISSTKAISFDAVSFSCNYLSPSSSWIIDIESTLQTCDSTRRLGESNQRVKTTSTLVILPELKNLATTTPPTDIPTTHVSTTHVSNTTTHVSPLKGDLVIILGSISIFSTVGLILKFCTCKRKDHNPRKTPIFPPLFREKHIKSVY